MGTHTSRLRILLVEDNPHDRRVFRRAFRKSQVPSEITECVRAEDALQVLSKEPMDASSFDLVVVDYHLPGMSGLDLYQAVSDDERALAFVMLTGTGTERTAVEALKAGMDDYLIKDPELGYVELLPVVLPQVVRKRGDRLARRRAEEQLQAKVGQLEDACQLLWDQAETMSEDLRRAQFIQGALLPRATPAIQGFAVNAVYRPCHNVGGNLYDVVRLGDHYLGAYVADAAGHGISAAMLAVLFKHRLHLTDERTGQPLRPAQVLSTVNQCLLHEVTASGLFITAAYCLLDTSIGELTVTSAGHPPLVLRHADGQIERISHTGPALGLSSGVQFAEHTTRLAHGERLLLYTDGLYEGSLERITAIDEAIVTTLQDAQTDGHALLESLLDVATHQQEETAQEDDITLLMLTGAEETSTLDNGTPTLDLPTLVLPLSKRSQLLIGVTEGQSTISIQGAGTWSYCAAFHEACVHELEAGCGLTLDVSLCDYLDSTFLGTTQEIVALAEQAKVALRLQGVLPQVRSLFDELGMEQVLGHICSDLRPLPIDMRRLGLSTGTDWQSRLRVLQAHETLAALNEHNRHEFLHLLEALHAEMSGEEESGGIT